MIALALQGAAAFNLVCTGTHTWGEMFKKPLVENRVQVTYRVDLDRGRWCSGKCETTAPLYGVTDTQIIFRLSEDKDAGADSITRVSRESGEYFNRDRWLLGDGLVSMTIGACERAPFTGFPAKRF